MRRRIGIMRSYFTVQNKKYELVLKNLQGDESIQAADIAKLNKDAEELMSEFNKN
jgi:hypothetical protein